MKEATTMKVISTPQYKNAEKNMRWLNNRIKNNQYDIKTRNDINQLLGTYQ